LALDRAQYDLLGYEWRPICRECDYDLSAVECPICPECGSERERSGSSPMITAQTMRRIYRLCAWQYLVPLLFIGLTTVILAMATNLPDSQLWGVVTPLGILTGVAMLWPVGAFLMLGPVLIRDLLRSPIENKARHVTLVTALGGVGPLIAEIAAILIASWILNSLGA
jgi:hypothetical protein